ncbi:MAG: DinB family protein [Actinomycetota bacterium]|nr:DinB family protein [Actinomycetota bacterium]
MAGWSTTSKIRVVEPPYVLPEREILERWLEFHRTTLLLKCEGLDDASRKSRPVTTSKLSLHGLLRHMAEVERNWFRRVLLGDAAPPIWYDPAIDDSELIPLDDASWEADLRSWETECQASRDAAALHELDDIGVRRGQQCSLRWIYVHLIEEYARHNGHADLLRELADGRVGW